MYIQITTRCNMHCKHCCFACTAKGTDMTRETYAAAIELTANRGDLLTIGGGEPTLHPDFWQFLGTAIGLMDFDAPLLVVTNGSQTETALALAKMAKAGVISADVSHDPWHDPIDPRVLQAFTKNPNNGYLYGDSSDSNDCRGIRNVSRGVGPTSVGRAKTTGVGTATGCICDTLFVSPNGKLWQCGCKKRQFGTVFAPEIPDDYESETCSRP